jgi:general secretion pathway protein N
MRTILVVLAAIVLLAAAAIALAPASLVAPTIAKVTSSRVALADVEGSIWSGQATLVGDDGARVPLAWTTEPAALARGELRVHLAPRGAGTTPRGDIEWKDGAVHARDLSFTVPAAWLAGAGSKALPFGVGGDVDVAIGSLDWSKTASQGDARVEWRNARLEAPGSLPLDLGDVTAQLAADGDRLAGPVANSGGALAISGDVAGLADGGGEANLLLTPRGANDALARVLASVGTPEGNGYRMRIRWPAR